MTRRHTPRSTARFALIGAGARRLRVGQWHADAPGIPLVMLGGIGMNIEMLEPVAMAMPGRRLIAIDMPGIGGSPDPMFPYSIPEIALTLAVLFDRLGIDQVDMLGISWGGALAQQFAFQHRARTRRLVLAATAAAPGMIQGSALTGALGSMAITDLSMEGLLRRQLASLYNGGGAAQISLNAATAPSPMGWACQMGAFALWSGAGLLPLLSLPVLIMADSDDTIVPPMNAHALHAAIADSEMVLCEGGGHLFMLSRADWVAAAINRFLGAPAQAAAA